MHARELRLRRPTRSSAFVALALAATSAAGAEAGRAAPGLAARLAAADRGRLAAEAERSGDASRGARVFHEPRLACTQCHAAGAGPARIGPNLAGMPAGVPPARLVEHIVESLLEPSAAIRPEHRAQTIVGADGTTRTGIVVRETPREIVLRDAAAGGRETAIAIDSVEERIPATVSLMPAGLVDLLAGRQEFLDLVRYLAEIARGGPRRAAALAPDPRLLAPRPLPAYESDVDHAGFIAEWDDPLKSKAALARGGAIYARVCATCHGTLDAPGSLPTAPRFAQGPFKAGSDPHALYRTLTSGTGLMVAQDWMVPSQKYDVIHYLRETFLREENPAWYTAVTPAYLAGLPRGSSRGPRPVEVEPWRTHDYGPFLAGSFEVGDDGANVARKGLAVRLDPGPGGVGRGHAWVLYELDTLRMAAFWTGDGFLDWAGINFDGRHSTHPHVVGEVQAAVASTPGWADPATGSFADPRPLGRDGEPYGPLPRARARFRAVHHAAAPDADGPRSAIVLDYTVGATDVLETPAAAPPLDADGRRIPVAVRSFSFGPRPRPLEARIAAAPAAAALAGPPTGGGEPPRIVVRDGHVDLVVPAGDAPLDLAVAIAAADPQPLARHAAAIVVPAPRSLVGRPAPPAEAPEVFTAAVAANDDGPFAVDVLTAPVSNPWNAQLRFSGIDFTGPDEAVLCTWDGDVWSVRGITAADGRLAWRRIASGLYQPLGIRVVGGAIHVGCRDRIVRLVDLDDDGLTDRYDTFNDDHQVTEHFHEFAMGLETDAAGDFYYAKSARHALPAVVPHHGTLLRVARDGSATEILATGFRAANGVCVDPDGGFWVTDQEGHWHPKNRINRVRRGGFYGNMLGWHDVADPSDAAMEQPAIWITNSFDRSPAELLRVTSAAWAPLTGALLELSYGEGRMHLVLTEPAAGGGSGPAPLMQGGMVALPIPDLPTGVMRGRFHTADGALYACGLYAWAGNRTQPGGFFRVRRTPRPLVLPVALHAEPGGIVLSFAEPLDPAAATAAAAWRLRTWGITRSARYGSKHVDEREREVAAARVSADGREVRLDVPGFAATRCYALEWTIAGADGTPVRGVLHGTMH